MSFACPSFTKEVRFHDLVQSINHCNLCQRLCGRTRVLSQANGSLNAKILFIAEAPGRLGADRTGIPLFGDRTGNNFEALLGNVGWRREDVFITNAILCNPRDGEGNNGTPTPEEVMNCSAYLEMTIALVRPDIIATLGATALNALDLIHHHGLSLSQNVGEVVHWLGIKLVPLYHPGPRAMIHRSMIKQRSDFMRLAKVVDPVKGLKTAKRYTVRPITPDAVVPQLHHAMVTILNHLGPMTQFKLTKLLYLADLASIRHLGKSITGEIYLREAAGPWPPSVTRALKTMNGRAVRWHFVNRVPVVSPGPSPHFEPHIDDSLLAMLSEVLEEYGAMTNAQIKTAVYLTDPMRYFLSEEKRGRDMRRVPVIYKDKVAPETDGGKGSPV